MFEDYLFDSNYFYQEALKSEEEVLKKRFFRVSIFCLTSAIEAFVNYIGSSIEIAESIDKNEIAFLNDKTIEIKPSSGNTSERTKYYSIEDKIKFIINRFNVEIDIGSDSNWSHFLRIKKLRDDLIHSREVNDETDIDEYKSTIKNGINSGIYLINEVSNKIFGKQLRRSLLDLKIE